jgi:hypothetical protein
VYAPDKTDPDAFARRLSVRSKHLEGVKKPIADGFIREPSTRMAALILISVLQELAVRC